MVRRSASLLAPHAARVSRITPLIVNAAQLRALTCARRANRFLFSGSYLTAPGRTPRMPEANIDQEMRLVTAGFASTTGGSLSPHDFLRLCDVSRDNNTIYKRLSSFRFLRSQIFDCQIRFLQVQLSAVKVLPIPNGKYRAPRSPRPRLGC